MLRKQEIMENKDKTVVSPFEFAIAQHVDPELVKDLRPETEQEKTERLTAKFEDFFNRVKVKP